MKFKLVIFPSKLMIFRMIILGNLMDFQLIIGTYYNKISSYKTNIKVYCIKISKNKLKFNVYNMFITCWDNLDIE